MLALPASFLERTRVQLGEDAESFRASYDRPRTQGLRLNELKIDTAGATAEAIRSLFRLEPVPWCPSGFYYEEPHRPGKHPYHAAGLYYIQEPSAMSAVELLAPKPGDVVLDLAAAPGGKTTQIAAKMGGSGLLIANEIHPGRAKILAENVERMGIAGAVVLNAASDQLSLRFPAYFDKIMLDAPCSGEGMFRKDPAAIAEWSPQHVTMCAARQADILRHAVVMLKPGGMLAYSTCTFNLEENEQTVDAIAKECPELEVIRIERIWPHLHKGEGHFVALLRKTADTGGIPPIDAKNFKDRKPAKNGGIPRTTAEAWAQFREFAASSLPTSAYEAALSANVPGIGDAPGEPLLFGDQLYWLPQTTGCTFRADDLQGLKTARPGLHLATVKKNRMEPAHALAIAMPRLKPGDGVVSLQADESRAIAYLKGEALAAEAEQPNGWTFVTIDGYPIGFGKTSDGLIKNHYPKGLRWLS
ncbi:RsmF rRNA methyltransferase first C-terminal domain-containing protein [Paenibacillus sp. MBLB4367]|uniref:RsmF rRNA methyltransferase first C-terminal domain-containing protein n=1 Tax=Paenibacillus sp. MBLB4367 TaxID=3384767 RepID=UPI003907E863